MRHARVLVGMVAAVAVLGLSPVTANASVAGGSAVVRDVTIRLAGDAPFRAYVVRPGGRQPAHSAAGVLFLHGSSGWRPPHRPS